MLEIKHKRNPTFITLLILYYIPQDMHEPLSHHVYQAISQQPRYWHFENQCHLLSDLYFFFIIALILSIHEQDIFHFLNVQIVDLYNSSANFLLDIISFFIAPSAAF